MTRDSTNCGLGLNNGLDINFRLECRSPGSKVTCNYKGLTTI